MFTRLRAAIAHAMGAAEQPGKPALLPAMAPEELRDVDFRSLDPASQGVATDAPLLCPVTRRELRPGDPIYQCRACRTSYSLAGWQFLRDVDRGRCCACGQQKTVYPLA